MTTRASLRFVLRWSRPGLTPPVAGERSHGWLPSPLRPGERAQLGLLVRSWAPGHTLDAFLAGDHDFHRLHTGGIAETPIELWDLVGPDGSPRFDLILAAADCGWLFEASTDTLVGVVRQWSFERLGGPASLATDLEEAQRSADPSDREGLLGLVTFLDGV